MPEAACVHDAITAIEQVSRVEPWNGALGVYLKLEKYTEAQIQDMNAKTTALMRSHGNPNYTLPPDISVFLSQPGGKPRFGMTYMGWRKSTDRAEIVAHSIVSQIALRCDLPALAARAVEKQDSIATPYLFGI